MYLSNFLRVFLPVVFRSELKKKGTGTIFVVHC